MTEMIRRSLEKIILAELEELLGAASVFIFPDNRRAWARNIADRIIKDYFGAGRGFYGAAELKQISGEVSTDILQNHEAIQALRVTYGASLPSEPAIVCGAINVGGDWRPFEPYRLLPDGAVEALT